MPFIIAEPSKDRRESYSEYVGRGGYQTAWAKVRTMEAPAVRTTVLSAGLRGRGGAGFPTAKKWELATSVESSRRILIINGAEGEPGSFKDRTLMTLAPHRVLEGILIGAHAIQATDILFYINDQFNDSISSLEQALREAEAAGLPVNTIKLLPETHTYIAGEETALINALMGLPAQPWHKPPYPTTQGYQGHPTIVNNVETLAVLPVIFEKGITWFVRNQPMLFSVTGDVRRPGVYEMPLGTPLSQLLDLAGGPAQTSIQAVLPGGFSMPWLKPEQFDTPLDYESLRHLGTGLGASIIVIGSERSLYDQTCQIADFFARETCGKCPLCVRGTRTLAEQMAQLANSLNPETVGTLVQSAKKFRHKGICSFLDTAAHMVEEYAVALNTPTVS
ncbi:MAG: SLBB domain-containing protein [Firmicutes bacterium]|nr:SLBB domain-containing protein [Bacillota bacterium]